MFIERLNKTNDLLSRAGATMYRTSFDITPEMDQLRRQVIVYVERKQEYDLRLNQAMLIAGVTLVLIAIFAMIFSPHAAFGEIRISILCCRTNCVDNVIKPRYRLAQERSSEETKK